MGLRFAMAPTQLSYGRVAYRCVASDCVPREHSINVRGRWFISPHWDCKPGLVHAIEVRPDRPREA